MLRFLYVFNEVIQSFVKSINDYINLFYFDWNFKNIVNENEFIKEDMEVIKKIFVFRYSL